MLIERPIGARGVAIAVATLCSACFSQAVRSTASEGFVSFRGSVFDSLMLVPLRGARVTLAAAETVTVVTDTNGQFNVSLRAGMWRAEVTHPRFDSLRLLYPLRQLDLPSNAVVSSELWTPSRRVATRMLCGDSARSDVAAVVELVRDAITHRAVLGKRHNQVDQSDAAARTVCPIECNGGHSNNA